MSSLESWAYLNRVVEGPSIHIQALLREGYSADQIAQGVRERASWIGPLLPATANRHTWDQPAQDLERAAEHGYTLLTPDSPGWPGEEMAIAFSRGVAAAEANKDTLPSDAVAPHGLWVKGNTDLASLCAQSVAFVGTRNITKYGRDATVDLVTGLAREKYTVVSGGAVGIDGIAHQTALDCEMKTVAVAACGPGKVYPRQHAELFERIAAADGAVVTEYPPLCNPERHRFLTRNRLVAALSMGTVLVEAPFRSGALNTLKWAALFRRRVMAVPGPITSAASLGTNLAIQNKRADMVLNAGQIHELLSRVGEVDAAEQLELEHLATPVQRLSRNELRVYDALPAEGMGGREAEEVAAAAGLTVALTVHLLMELLGRGLVARHKRQWERTTVPTQGPE